MSVSTCNLWFESLHTGIFVILPFNRNQKLLAA